MSVNLRPHSEKQPLVIDQEEYDRLIKRAQGGWSQCADEKEWLAKLHYLRQGFVEGKLNRQQFEERETRLVTAWLRALI